LTVIEKVLNTPLLIDIEGYMKRRVGPRHWYSERASFILFICFNRYYTKTFFIWQKYCFPQI